MRISTRPQGVELAANISSIWCYQSDVACSYEHVLPGVAGQLLINLHENELRHWIEPGILRRQCGAVGIQGVLTKPVLIDSTQKQNICGVAFKPTGLYMVTGLSADQFTDTIVDASDIWGAQSSDLRSTLISEENPEKRCQVLEAFLSEKLIPFQSEDALVNEVLLLMDRGVNLYSIRDKFNLSQRFLLKLFLRHVGVRPKTYARIRRIGSTLKNMPESRSLSDLAFEYGFSDQAHFAREFRAYTGSSPTQHQPIETEWRHALAPVKKNFKTG